MHFLNYFYSRNLKFDLINKFYYSNLNNMPKLKKIILNSSSKTTELKALAKNLLALELVTSQQGILTTSKRPNILLKIRKGNPVGCKLTLKKTCMLSFLSKISNEIFPKIRNFDGIVIHKKIEREACSFIIKDIMNFSELTDHYSIFNSISHFSLSFIIKANGKKEMLFLLKSLQLPLKS